MLNIFSIWGMIWVEGLHSSPIVFLLMVAAFRSMDPSLEESALMSGATRLQTLRRVTLPLVRPALLSSVLVILITSLESFEVPALLGLQNGIYVFTSRIYFVFRSYPRDLQAAGALAVSLLAIAVIGVIIARLLAGRGTQDLPDRHGQGLPPAADGPGQVAAGRRRRHPHLLLRHRASARCWCCSTPSLLPYYQAPSVEAFQSFTLDNYRQVFEMDSAGRALREQPGPGPQRRGDRHGADVDRGLDLGPVDHPAAAASSSS